MRKDKISKSRTDWVLGSILLSYEDEHVWTDLSDHFIISVKCTIPNIKPQSFYIRIPNK